MAKEIGVAPKEPRHVCAECGGPLDNTDLANYAFLSVQNIVECVPCFTLHELKYDKLPPTVFVVWAGVALIWAAYLMIQKWFLLDFMPGYIVVSGLALVGGFALALYLSRLILRVHKWYTAHMVRSKYQSRESH